MKVKALCSFAGVITMAEGEVRNVDDVTRKDVIQGLARAGYIEIVENKEEAKEEKENKADEGAGEDPVPAKPKRRVKK